jgi:uncharacterized coiled-coil protein SlyX
MQEMEDRLIELEAMQKVLLEGVGQLNSALTALPTNLHYSRV